MRSAKRGRLISEVEVTNISKHGFWLLLEGRELFLPFEDFPWFRNVPVGKLLNVQLPHAHHLYWPDLDVDLAVESIDHPECFPLISKMGTNEGIQGSIVGCFNYESPAREARVPSDKLDQLCRRIQPEFPHDQMMYELHILRACMAIKSGGLTIEQALPAPPAQT